MGNEAMAVSLGLNEVTRPSLLVEKACITKLKFNSTVCDNIKEDEYEDQLDEVEKTVTSYESALSSAAIAPRILFTLFGNQQSKIHSLQALHSWSLVR